MKKLFLIFASLGMMITSGALASETHVVKMLNKGSDGTRMVFEPSYLEIQPGDSVSFVAESKGHNTQSIKKMIPEGAEKWKSKLSKDFEITFTKEGTYGYKCAPHYNMGMVGLIVVGDPSGNLDAVMSKKTPGKSKKVFKKLFEQVKQ